MTFDFNTFPFKIGKCFQYKRKCVDRVHRQHEDTVGLARGWASTGIPSMTSCDDLYCTNPDLVTMEDGGPLSEDIISWILATLPSGSMIGCWISLILLRCLGRRLTIIISGLSFAVAFLGIGQ